MTKLFVIFNPSARGEKSQQLLRFLEAKARASGAVTLAPTQSAGDATRLAVEGIAAGNDVIVAAGGDGTINEIVNGLGTGGATLGVVPLGTVNVFARELGIPLNFERAWAVLERSRTRVVDVACAEFAGQRRRYFVQLAGVGLDARAVRMASWELKKQLGPLSYVWAGLQALRMSTAPIEVTGIGGELLATGGAVFVGNGRFYGGPFRLFPKARLDDGLLDVCVFDRVGYWNALRCSVGVLCGQHTRWSGVNYFQTKQITCRSVGETPVQLDGEDAGDATVTFTVAPGALRVVVPGGV